MKTCIDCKMELSFDNFYIRKSKKDGYDNKCKKCKSVYNRKYRCENIDKIEEYRELNREKILISSKKWRDENKDIISEYGREYRDKNRNSIEQYREDNKLKQKEYSSLYYQKNKDILLKKNSLRKKVYKDSNILFKISENIRSLIFNSFVRNGYSKTSKTQVILGCSFEEFKLYLESKFETWMNWENRGLYNGEFNHGWDIDHIIPISSAETEEDIIKLNHYTNLQPLCSKVNRNIKKNKIEYEIY